MLTLADADPNDSLSKLQGLGKLKEAMINYEKALISSTANEPLKTAMQSLREKIRTSHDCRETDRDEGAIARTSLAPTPASFDGILDEVPSNVPTPIDTTYAPAPDVEGQVPAPPHLAGNPERQLSFSALSSRGRV